MATDPRTSARYPVSTNVPNVAQDIQNAVNDLSDTTVPRYTTAASRDSAHSAWVSQGNTMASGLMCTVAGDPVYYINGTWQPLLPHRVRRVTSTASGTLAANASVNLTPAQSVVSPCGSGINYIVDVDASVSVSLPAGLGVKMEILVDGVMQDGDTFTNAGTSGMTYTSHVRTMASFADNNSHTIVAAITALAGTITVSTTYGRMFLMARPYVTF